MDIKEARKALDELDMLAGRQGEAAYYILEEFINRVDSMQRMNIPALLRQQNTS